MTTMGHQFKELFLACDPEERLTVVRNLKQIFRVYFEAEAEDDNDFCFCGLIDLYSMVDDYCSEEELRDSNVWDTFIDCSDSSLLRKVVTSGLDIFKVKGAW
jgi:hypothetical protein